MDIQNIRATTEQYTARFPDSIAYAGAIDVVARTAVEAVIASSAFKGVCSGIAGWVVVK